MNVKTVLKGRYDDNTETRNIFYHITDSTDPVENVNGSAEFIAEFIDALLPIISTLWSAYAADVYEGDGTVTGWNPIGTYTLSNAGGTSAEDYNANQDAAVLIAKTETKKSVGKKFIAGLAESVAENGQNDDNAMPILADVLSIWIAEFISTGGVTFTPVIWRKLAGAFTLIIGGVVDRVIGSQRRRKPNLGI